MKVGFYIYVLVSMKAKKNLSGTVQYKNNNIRK